MATERQENSVLTSAERRIIAESSMSVEAGRASWPTAAPVVDRYSRGLDPSRLVSQDGFERLKECPCACGGHRT